MALRDVCWLAAILGLLNTQPLLAQVSIGTTTGGTLAEAGGQGNRLESSTAGQLTVIVGSTTPNTSIQVLPPILVAGPSADPGGTSRTAIANVNGITITSNGPGDTATLMVGINTVLVDIQIERPSMFPSGNYQYSTDILITPN
jgi:hypothetical protein